MNVLIVYATYSGSTQAAAQFLNDTLLSQKHAVTMKLVSETTFEELSIYDLIIFGSPSWDYDGKEGQPHIDFIPFIQKMEGKDLAQKPCAVFGLGDSTYAHFCGAVEHLEEMVKKMNGKLFSPSLRIDGYYFNQEVCNKQITEWATSLVTSSS